MVQQLFFMELKFILESLLIAAPKPLTAGELRDILTRAADEEGAPEHVCACRKLPVEKIEEALSQLAKEHEAAARSFRLLCVAGAWQFATLPEFGPWLRSFVGVKNRPAKLSQPALESLAVIAYRQPVTRAEIEQIRGVAVDGVIATLKERGLIEEAGRAEVIGRPMQYATTSSFLEYFGLSSLEALPAADELRRIPVQRPESLATTDAQLPLPTGAEASAEAAQPAVESAPATAIEAAGESTPAAEAEPEAQPAEAAQTTESPASSSSEETPPTVS
jgi:segregation and condensation protein B